MGTLLIMRLIKISEIKDNFENDAFDQSNSIVNENGIWGMFMLIMLIRILFLELKPFYIMHFNVYQYIIIVTVIGISIIIIILMKTSYVS